MKRHYRSYFNEKKKEKMLLLYKACAKSILSMKIAQL